MFVDCLHADVALHSWASADMPLLVLSLYRTRTDPNDDGTATVDAPASAIPSSTSSASTSSSATTSTSTSRAPSKAVTPIDPDCTLVDAAARANPVTVAKALDLSSLSRQFLVLTTNIDDPRNVAPALAWIAERVKAKAWESRRLG
jgi:hypothetical protein